MSDKITLPKGSRHYDSFNNYVDRKRGGVSRKSTLDHVSKGRYHINVHSKWGAGGGQNWVKFGRRSC